MDQSHFLRRFDERPEGYGPRRRCLLKGCERLFLPCHWRSRFCSKACQQAVRRWQRWRANQKYRATEKGRGYRQEQSRRQRQRRRERQAASADIAPSREGERIQPGSKNSSDRPCHRPGCYTLFTPSHEHSCKRFCSVVCRLALRRVLDREARYRARRRRLRRERVTRRARPPNTS